MTLKNPQFFKEGKKWGQFSVSKRVVLPFIIDSKKWPVLQYRHESGYAKQLRLEFSPVDLGSTGLDDLHVALVTLIPDGWPFVLQNGRITGIEVSVDVPKVDINDFNVMPQQVTTARSWSTGGKLETLVLGKSKGNQTKLYNRAAKRKAKGQTSPHYEGTRIERRLRLVHNLPLIKLPSMPNPFLGLKMVALPPSKPPSEPKSYMWEMFMDSVAQRSLPVALKLLPIEKRTLYRAWLAQYPVGWWDPATIWSHWPEYVMQSGLLGIVKGKVP